MERRTIEPGDTVYWQKADAVVHGYVTQVSDPDPDLDADDDDADTLLVVIESGTKEMRSVWTSEVVRSTRARAQA